MSSGYHVPEAKGRVLSRDRSTYSEKTIRSGSLKPLKLSQGSKNGAFYYAVRIVTGSEIGAGTLAVDVYITLVGAKASCARIPIVDSKLFKIPTTYTNCYDDLMIESGLDLGELLVVIIGNPKDTFTLNPFKAVNNVVSAVTGSAWFVSFVDVIDFQTRQTLEFPCYHWINDGEEMSLTASTNIPNGVNSILQQQRASQIELRQKKYKYVISNDLHLPSYVDESCKGIANDEQFGVVKNIDFTSNAVSAALGITAKSAITCIDSLSQYEKLATAMCYPSLALYKNDLWMKDEEFGRQILNGVNPILIQRCSVLPANFPVTNEMVKGSLVRGLSLEDEMKAGHVYICDLTILDGLKCRSGQFCAAPICLLYVNDHNYLVPIAIQLKKQPGSDNPIFLPSDSAADWILAKTYYRSAHSQFHEIAIHYHSCHAAMEAYAVGVMRNLPDAHPVFKLLVPHFRYTMAINTRARANLINDGGIIDLAFAIGGEGRRELMRRAGIIYDVNWSNIKKGVKDRGVDDPNLLPGYQYRDDGLKIWQAIEDYVKGITDMFYKSDEDVSSDAEVQSWAGDTYQNGFPAHGGLQGHGFPRRIETKQQLVETCTLIMFSGSAQHAAINFLQYDIYSYVPNAPFSLCLPPPSKKGQANHDTLLQALKGCSGNLLKFLPGFQDWMTPILSITLVYALSQNSPDELYCGNYPAERFTESQAKEFILKFRMALSGIDLAIMERNKHIDVPYQYLMPSKVPNSITI